MTLSIHDVLFQLQASLDKHTGQGSTAPHTSDTCDECPTTRRLQSQVSTITTDAILSTACLPLPMSAGVNHVLAGTEPRVEPLVTDFKKDGLEQNGREGILSPLSPFTATSPGSELSDETRALPVLDSEVKTSGFYLSSDSIDEERPMKVVVIGAGFSGVIAGIRSASACLLDTT